MGGIRNTGTPLDPKLADVGDLPDVGTKDLIEEGMDGKHLVLGVTDFRNGMNSYLRLGAASPLAGDHAQRGMGEDLATLVQGFTDDTRKRNNALDSPPALPQAPTQALDLASPAIPPPTFTDAPPQRTATSADLRDESKQLHKKGGWRDHSDGNRITTTRGDKVEVIRGNYKLVVLGRLDSDDALKESNARSRAAKVKRLLDNAGGMDISGGLNDYNGDLSYGFVPDNTGAAAHGTNAAGPPGAEWDNPEPSRDQRHLSIEYEWTVDSDMKWSWTQTTTMGTDDPAELLPPENAGNYRLITNTYVDYQETNLGSEKKLVNNVVSETWAQDMSAKVHVAGVNHTQTSGGTINNGTDVAILNDVTAAIINQETKLGSLLNEIDLIETGIGLLQVSATISTAQIAAQITNISLGNTFDLHCPTHIDIHAGAHMETHTGLHTDTHTGVHLDQHLGVHTDLHLGPHYTVDTALVEITGDKIIVDKSKIDLTNERLELTSGIRANTTLMQAINIAQMHFHI